MKIRYQNGSAFEGITLSRTQQTMRVAVKGGDDVLEFTNIHGTWVSEDCEPVTMEVGMTCAPVENLSEDDFICSQELAAHLVSLLFNDSTGDFFEEQSLWKTPYTGISPLIG
jgi:hypothetical protein